MKQILIACGDVDLLRRIAGDLPQDQYKPIATKSGGKILAKLQQRGVDVAVVHETLQDGPGASLCQSLQQLSPAPRILFVVTGDVPDSGPFDLALKYPVPGVVFRNALKRIASEGPSDQDLESWRTFYNEIKARLEKVPSQNYFQMLGLKVGAPHHLIVRSFDALSERYHPDRYNQHRKERWGAAIFETVNQLYKVYTEAFKVLTDRKLRAKYDLALSRGEQRLSAEETSGQDTGPRALTDHATTSQSKKFLRLAQSDIARKNWSQALQNLQFAHSMEPDNAAISAKIAEIEAKQSSE